MHVLYLLNSLFYHQVPGNHCYVYYLCSFGFSRIYMYKYNHALQMRFFNLETCIYDSSKSLHSLTPPSILLLNRTPVFVYTIDCFSIKGHLLKMSPRTSWRTWGHLDCFQVWAIMNKTVINISVLLYVDINFQKCWINS